MAVKVNEVNPKKNALSRFVVILIAVAVMGGLMLWVTSQNTEFQKTVSVVMWDAPVGVSEIIREDGKQLKRYDMYYKEFMNYGTYTDVDGTTKRSIVLWDEREQLYGKYVSNYQRANTVVFWDNVVPSKERSNPYLYKIKNKEFLKMNGFSPREYGDILVPGDRINVRVAYEDNDYTLPPEELAMLHQSGEPPKIIRQEMLFSDVSIVDMLNSGGESIFDAFYELLALPAQQRETLINDENFKSKITPDAYLLALTPEQIDKYIYLTKKSSMSITVTVLPRTDDSIILDYLRDLIKAATEKDSK